MAKTAEKILAESMKYAATQIRNRTLQEVAHKWVELVGDLDGLTSRHAVETMVVFNTWLRKEIEDDTP